MAVSKCLFACARAYFKVKRAWRREESLPAEKRTRGQLLRSELSKLGPFAVKIGQTLSQRPDMIAPDVCEELKGLQMTNTPFPNEVAWKVIADELGWEGPIAPGLPLPPGCSSGDKTLFAALSPAPIASASLGQVICVSVSVSVSVSVCVFVCVLVCMCVYVCVCVYMYVYMYRHI
jgi:predicted unusual protein kinase regulating ubiquinone biosynthesis (AarF/ABC1/UbiB family)